MLFLRGFALFLFLLVGCGCKCPVHPWCWRLTRGGALEALVTLFSGNALLLGLLRLGHWSIRLPEPIAGKIDSYDRWLGLRQGVFCWLYQSPGPPEFLSLSS